MANIKPSEGQICPGGQGFQKVALIVLATTVALISCLLMSDVVNIVAMSGTGAYW